MFSKLCGCYLWQWRLDVSLWRKTYCLGSSLGFWEHPWKPFSQPLNWMKFIPSTRPAGVSAPSLFGDFIRSPSYLTLGFHTAPQMPLNSSCLYPHDLPQPHLTSQFSPDLPILVPCPLSSPSINRSISISQGDPCAPSSPPRPFLYSYPL